MFHRRTKAGEGAKAACLAALFVVAGATGASAGQNDVFGAEPYPNAHGETARRSFDIPQGALGELADSIRVYNRTSKTLRLSLYPAEASLGAAGVISIGSDTRPSGLARAITLDVSEVTLAPKSEAIVSFAIDAKAARGADAMAAVVVEGAPSAGLSDLDLVQRIAILVRPSGKGNLIAPTDRVTGGGLPIWLYILLGGAGVVASQRRHRSVRSSPQG